MVVSKQSSILTGFTPFQGIDERYHGGIWQVTERTIANRYRKKVQANSFLCTFLQERVISTPTGLTRGTIATDSQHFAALG